MLWKLVWKLRKSILNWKCRRVGTRFAGLLTLSVTGQVSELRADRVGPPRA